MYTHLSGAYSSSWLLGALTNLPSSIWRCEDSLLYWTSSTTHQFSNHGIACTCARVLYIVSLQLHVTKCEASLLVVDKQPSKRTLRRLRLRLARHLAKEKGQQQDLQPSSKRMCIEDSDQLSLVPRPYYERTDQPSDEPGPSFDTGGDGALRSDWELSGSEVEEPHRFGRCGDLNTDHSELSDEELVSDTVELQSGSDDNFENWGSDVESDNLDREDDNLDSCLSDEADFSELESVQSSNQERGRAEPTLDHVPLYCGSHISYPDSDFNVAFLVFHNMTYVCKSDRHPATVFNHFISSKYSSFIMSHPGKQVCQPQKWHKNSLLLWMLHTSSNNLWLLY